jgi:Tfp pilus assembly protein PilZ
MLHRESLYSPLGAVFAPPPNLPDQRGKEVLMSRFRSDRRLAGRHKVKTPLRVRLWKSLVPECTAESVNLSQRGIYFATDSPLRTGETVEVLFNMPEKIVGEPESEWRCTGHVVRVEKINTISGKQGVGVQFDCYEVSRSKPVDVAIGTGAPVRMLSDLAPNGDRIQPWKKERSLSTMNQPHVN